MLALVYDYDTRESVFATIPLKNLHILPNIIQLRKHLFFNPHSMGEMLATVLGPFYVVLGLSILLYAGSWQKIMKKWEKDHLALFPLMTMLLVFGLIMVNLYNVWVLEVWLLVTLIGWIWLIKGAAYFLLPGEFVKWKLSMGKNTSLLYVGGVAALVMGAVLTYYSYFI
jgi:hypothetical protein